MGYLTTGIDADVIDLGLVDYEQSYSAMQSFQRLRNPQTRNQIWVLQHNPVFTLGRNGKKEHILDAGDIPVVLSDRGGQVTYHGPGQLIIYTLIDLKRCNIGIKQWVNHLENSIIQLLNDYHIEAKNNPKAPGVYVGDKKIAALGLRVSKGRCYHGMSLNIDMNLEPFMRINPCGYQGLEITQCRHLGISDSFEEISRHLVGDLITTRL
ncbi:MAG: lipoyl(octanoyl) transferase LipB [Thiotrichaceae bacterium]|nr:lipoyl(octanoyl) transferase LipB [Thiotrichaceae bacterium]